MSHRRRERPALRECTLWFVAVLSSITGVSKPKIADEIVRPGKTVAKLINWSVNNFLRRRSASPYWYIADARPNGY
jgi:hypothetical protein